MYIYIYLYIEGNEGRLGGRHFEVKEIIFCWTIIHALYNGHAFALLNIKHYESKSLLKLKNYYARTKYPRCIY